MEREASNCKILQKGLRDSAPAPSRPRQSIPQLGERRFTEAVLNSIGALVKVVDTEGRLIRFNRGCELLSGYAAKEAEGQCIWDLLIDEADRAKTQQTYAGVVQGRAARPHSSWW